MMNRNKKNQREEDFIPIKSKSPGEPDIAGYGQLRQDVERINTRMEVVVYALFVAFIVALISVFGIFIDAYRFHSESYQEFRQALNEEQKYNEDYKNLKKSVDEIKKQIKGIKLILKEINETL